MPLFCLDDKGKNCWIDGLDILYIDLYKRKKLRFHLLNGVYVFQFDGSLETCVRMFSPFGFEELDSKNLVNINKIKYIDDKLRIAYFDNNLHTTISFRNMYKVEHLPKKE
ncbi:LytTR family transcriptional regulator DNA-binding domain-containing protein [Paenibacillus tyrfis]|uniref:HTH LytTR-type domain-containing protein n=1 Tax=Paenibacillus tyrfis TaxID=1501230 RepID=A0A081P4C1_9BACL|nr:hypothetical protein ET33_02140 [Paenibacillus tyrfis]